MSYRGCQNSYLDKTCFFFFFFNIGTGNMISLNKWKEWWEVNTVWLKCIVNPAYSISFFVFVVFYSGLCNISSIWSISLSLYLSIYHLPHGIRETWKVKIWKDLRFYLTIHLQFYMLSPFSWTDNCPGFKYL